MITRTLLRTILLFVTLAVGLVLCCTAFAGHIDPRVFPLASVAAMGLPIAVVVAIIVLVADLIWAKPSAILMGLFMLASSAAVLTVFPLHIGGGKVSAEEEPRAWTLLSYNVIDFEDQTGQYAGNVNPTVSYILSTDADVVCLQEAEYLCRYQPTHFTSVQVDSLSKRYPYILTNGAGLYLLSKFKAKPIRLSQATSLPGAGEIAGYALDIHGRRVALYNVHLASIGLNDDDKRLYRDITGLKKGHSVKEVKNAFFGKIETAAAHRASQVESLVGDIRKTGGTNVVVCGDFNDVPGCWALRKLEDAGLSEVYPKVGFGYMNTYNRNRFYFQIDHVLWRGEMQPKSMKRAKVMWSDHYPVLTTFVLNEQPE
ncbi:MAG: endonuclease/exonuclease/phosphatase family protein [Muribaculaceae bacterium]|nr:endonuclease/exonuclease/phosphatase family protein [Muribaculaceae bacterium]